MLYTAIAFFLIAGLFGFYLLTFILQNKNTPKAIAFIHGPLAATGLIILIIYATSYRPSPFISLSLFILAAILGSILIFRDLTNKSLPKWLALLHGLTALIALGFLIFFVMMK